MMSHSPRAPLPPPDLDLMTQPEASSWLDDILCLVVAIEMIVGTLIAMRLI